MPQLDTSTMFTQVVWLVIAFAVLYALLSRKVLPRVGEILEARQDRIAADLQRAGDLRQEAEIALAEYEALIARARDEAHARQAEIRERWAEDAAERTARLEAETAERFKTAEAAIAEATRAALDELHDVAVEVSQAATERLIGVTVDRTTAETALSAIEKEAA